MGTHHIKDYQVEQNFFSKAVLLAYVERVLCARPSTVYLVLNIKINSYFSCFLAIADGRYVRVLSQINLKGS